ncbi:MAG: 50S ribosomal protein L30 [Negativicutes bacterium]|jgi:large subunit ribosomal protein L30|nr:50S ribosomal protein L30 [Negativicutes bacterium]
MAAKLKIVLKRSLIGRPDDQKSTVRVLGLTKIQQSVLQEDTPAIRGMIRKVEHLVSVEELEQ